jgi:peptidoglycan hydrolase-like protein with peptidoglycan-binding domain
MAKGYDWAFSPHPGAAALTGAGATFAVRYLSDIAVNNANGKNLTLSERNALRAAGLVIAVVYETAADRALSGNAAGISDAKAAESELATLGMSGMPVYFAADFDATPANQAAVNAYLDGAASVIGKDRTGLYAGYYPVKRAFDAGKITFGWQTYAWSGGLWDNRAQLRQVKNGVTVGGASCDLDQSMTPDFGQWPRPSAFPLKAGMSDPDATGLIGTMQRNINRWAAHLGASVQILADGVFGPVTEAAVTAAQLFFGERGQIAGQCDQALFSDLAAPVPATGGAPAGLKQQVVSTGAHASFQWTAVPGAGGYRIQVEWYKPGFGWVLSVDKALSVTSDTEVLAGGTKHRWRVSGGAWSAWAQFTTAA